MKKCLLIVLGMLLTASVVFAQDKTVSGKVIADDGSSLPGVNVILKGTSSGTVTDVDGNFKLTVPGEGAVLTFSFIGFRTVEMIVGNQSVIDLTMDSESTQLTEVVVTALGITREKAALGYSVATIGNDLIDNRPEADVGRLLRGKAPGVEIAQTSGLAGTGTNIIIRGLSSVSGSNQPLFIVDGVVFNSQTSADRSFAAGGATASSRFLDLDPKNIAEINILKGLSATVLYGAAGRNGVVLVTTKTGKGGRTNKGFEISLDQDITWNTVANLPDYQDSFGNGFSGNFGWFFSNWGPSFDTRGSNGIDDNGQITHPYDQPQYNEAFPEFIDQRYDYRPYSSVEDFFQTGIQSNTSINVKGNVGNNSSISFAYSNISDNGFIPDNKNQYRKNNLSIGAQTKLDNGLSFNGTFNLISSYALKPPAASGSGSNPSGASLFANLIYTPRSMDLLNLPFQSPVDGSNVYYRRGSAIQNPLWTLNNVSDTENVQRYFGQIALGYEITDWLNLSYKLGFDETALKTVRRLNKGGSQLPDGEMRDIRRNTTIIDHYINLGLKKDLNENFDFDMLLGANFRMIKGTALFATSTQQFIFDLFTQQNFKEHFNESLESVDNTVGAYGTATLGYRDYLYLNVQGRNDWTSTLEQENNSIFYPSASLSFVATDAISALSGSSAINFLKARVGYGTSAGYPDPYQTRNTLTARTKQFITRGGNQLDINSVSTRLGNSNLTPELHTEIEVGIEGRFIDNRISLDLSLYNKESKDLIIDLDLDPATGFTNTTVNAAEIVNKGIELALGITPIRGAVTWDLLGIYTRNDNKVISIFEGVDQVPIGNSFDGLSNWAIPGEDYGVFQGTAYERRDGQILVDASGIPVPKGDIEIIGNPNPDWTGSIQSTLTWKGFSLYALFQYQKGGDIYSLTTATMLARGNTVDTDVDRFLPVVFPGVKTAANGEIVPNDIQAYIGDLSFRAYFFANEGGIFDATSARLRELSLSYALPSSILEKTPFGSASLRITGENLWYKAFNFPEGVNYDPDVVSTGVSNQRGMEFITGPTIRKIGVGISLTF